MSLTHQHPAAPARRAAPYRVVVVGGGVAALETVLALGALAEGRVRVSVVAPAADYVDRPSAVGEPFGRGPRRRYPLATLVGDMGADLIVDRLDRVHAGARQATTEGGTVLDYDALVLAVGACRQKGFTHATTIDDRILDEQLHGLVQDVEGGYVHRIAFVVPERTAWPLPLYELALMTAERAFDASASAKVTLVTPEAAPLAIFGTEVSRGVADLLEAAGIVLITETRARVPVAGRVTVGHGRAPLEVDRVLALPELFGPSISGVPSGAHGFIPVDPYGRVAGTPDVYAAGDGCDYPIKHGGIAAQQAQTIAAVIAEAAGADVTPKPLRAELHAMLMTGAVPKYLSARAGGQTGFASAISDAPGWSPATKIAARYLAPFLREHDAVAAGGTGRGVA